MQHVRQAGEMRSDRRFANQLGRGPRSRSIVNRAPTLCGEPGTSEDFDVQTARSFVERFAVVKPEWLADMCPACRSKLS